MMSFKGTYRILPDLTDQQLSALSHKALAEYWMSIASQVVRKIHREAIKQQIEMMPHHEKTLITGTQGPTIQVLLRAMEALGVPVHITVRSSGRKLLRLIADTRPLGHIDTTFILMKNLFDWLEEDYSGLYSGAYGVMEGGRDVIPGTEIYKHGAVRLAPSAIKTWRKSGNLSTGSLCRMLYAHGLVLVIGEGEAPVHTTAEPTHTIAHKETQTTLLGLFDLRNALVQQMVEINESIKDKARPILLRVRGYYVLARPDQLTLCRDGVTAALNCNFVDPKDRARFEKTYYVQELILNAVLDGSSYFVAHLSPEDKVVKVSLPIEEESELQRWLRT